MTLPVSTQKKIDLACVVLFPAGLLFVFVLSLLGFAIGEHGDTYIAATHVVISMLTIILPLIRYTRKLVFPYWFIAIITVNIYLYGIPLFLGFYDNIWWWDEFSHWMSSTLVGLVVFMALCIIVSMAKTVVMSTNVLCFLTFVGGFAFGNVWEAFEGIIDWSFGGDYMQHMIADTLDDIHMDFLGAVTMAIPAHLILRKMTADELVNGIDEQRILHNIVQRKKLRA